jgi:hypothetical protein
MDARSVQRPLPGGLTHVLPVIAIIVARVGLFKGHKSVKPLRAPTMPPPTPGRPFRFHLRWADWRLPEESLWSSWGERSRNVSVPPSGRRIREPGNMRRDRVRTDNAGSLWCRLPGQCTEERRFPPALAVHSDADCGDPHRPGFHAENTRCSFLMSGSGLVALMTRLKAPDGLERKHVIKLITEKRYIS